MAQSLIELLNVGADGDPALLAPGRPALRFARPREQCRRTLEALNRRGPGRGDQAGIWLEETPEGATGKLQRIGPAEKPGMRS